MCEQWEGALQWGFNTGESLVSRDSQWPEPKYPESERLREFDDKLKLILDNKIEIFEEKRVHSCKTHSGRSPNFRS